MVLIFLKINEQKFEVCDATEVQLNLLLLISQSFNYRLKELLKEQ